MNPNAKGDKKRNERTLLEFAAKRKVFKKFREAQLIPRFQKHCTVSQPSVKFLKVCRIHVEKLQIGFQIPITNSGLQMARFRRDYDTLDKVDKLRLRL